MKDSRLLAVWCPDWPVVAACTASGTSQHVPVAVLDGNEIVATSAVARAEGLRRAMRKRMAESMCPELVTFDHDPQRDARFFEPVAEAVEELAPGIEVVQPGLVAVPASTPGLSRATPRYDRFPHCPRLAGSMTAAVQSSVTRAER